MDGRLAILFNLVSFFGEHTEIGGFHMDRGDISDHFVVSAGPTLQNGRSSSFETRISYAMPKKWLHFNPMIDISFTDKGAVWAGFGLYQQFDFEIADQDLFFGFYTAPGFYSAGNDIDLGLALQFRAGFEFGAVFHDDWRLALSYDHRSNADLSSVNPGVETLQLRFSKPFGG